MTAKLEVTITDEGSSLAIEITSTDGRTAHERAHLMAMVGTLRTIVADLNKPTPGCNCPTCRGRREANHVRQNMH